MAPKSIAVIGAGATGLLVAAELKNAGLNVTVFERTSDVGGVWQKNYAGFALQVDRWHYEIPGYVWDTSKLADPKYPTGPEVQEYFRSYAQDAGLYPLIKFGVSVKALSPKPVAAGEAEGSSGWTLEYADAAPGSASKTEHFDFVVVASGLYSNPRVPDWARGRVSEEPPASGTWIVDARDFTDEKLPLAKGKDVVVIGAGKTAIDVGVITSKVAAKTTIVARGGKYMFPRWVFGSIPYEFFGYTRFAAYLQPAYYADSVIKKQLHKFLLPFKRAIWNYFREAVPPLIAAPEEIRPKYDIWEGSYDTAGIVDDPAVAEAFTSGRLLGHGGQVTEVLGDGHVQLDNGTRLKADIIVLGTGYNGRWAVKDLLPQELQAKAGYKEDGNQWLYRNVLPPQLANLAYAGLHASVQHVLTVALEARWLKDVVKGSIALPSTAEQLRDLAAQEEWVLHDFDGVKRRTNHIWGQQYSFHEQLIADIKAGSTNGLREWVTPGEGAVHGWFIFLKNHDYAAFFPHNVALTASKAKAAASRPNGVTAYGCGI